MLALKLNESALDLRSGAVDLTATNPALDAGGQARTFTMPFKLAHSGRTLAALRSAARLDARATDDEPNLTAELFVGGSSFGRGVLGLTRHGVDETEATFTRQEFDFWKRMDGIKLRQVAGSVPIPQTVQAVWTMDFNTAFVDFAIQINGENFPGSGATTADAGAAVEAAVNAVYPSTAGYNAGANALQLYAMSNDPFDVDVPAGMESRITVTGMVTVGMAREANLRNYVTGLFTTPVASHSFPVISAPDAYGPNNPLYTFFFNDYDSGYATNVPNAEKKHATTYVPQVRLKWLLQRLATTAGYSTWAGSVFDFADFAELSILNVLTLDNYHRDYDTIDDEYKEVNAGPTAIDLGLCLPDLTAGDFLRRFCAGFGLWIDIRGGTLTLRRRLEQLSGSIRDYSKFNSREVSRTIVKKKDWYLAFKDDENETNIAATQTQLLPYGDLDGERVELPMKPMYEVLAGRGDLGLSEKIRVAQWNGLVGSDPFGLKGKCDLRFFFDRGVQQTGLLNAYLQSSVGVLATDPVTIIGDWALDFGGPKGLAVLWHGDWPRLQFQSKIETRILLSAAEVRDLMKWRRARVRLWHPLGEVIGLVEEVQVTATPEGVGLARVRLVRL